jgi:hypothetical protein
MRSSVYTLPKTMDESERSCIVFGYIGAITSKQGRARVISAKA